MKTKQMGDWCVDECTHCYRVMVDSREGVHQAAIVARDFEEVVLSLEVCADGRLRLQTSWLCSLLIDADKKIINVRTSEERLTSEEWLARHDET